MSRGGPRRKLGLSLNSYRLLKSRGLRILSRYLTLRLSTGDQTIFIPRFRSVSGTQPIITEDSGSSREGLGQGSIYIYMWVGQDIYNVQVDWPFRAKHPFWSSRAHLPTFQEMVFLSAKLMERRSLSIFSKIQRVQS